MIYRDREYLTVLTLTEDRDYVTYDELIRALEERPSNAVYIERDGLLCGLITSGRIWRSRDEENRRVPFNKKFTFIRPGKNMRAHQIFRDKRTINALPVVSEDGRLLGEYVRCDDLIDKNYFELLCADSYVLQKLKDNIQDAVLVEPNVRRGGMYTRIVSMVETEAGE